MKSKIGLIDSVKQRVVEISATRRSGSVSLRGLLLLISLLYGAAVRARVRYYANGRSRVRKLPCFVISIGNLTAGGTGKTPMTVYLARQLLGTGMRIAVLSRGYKGAMEKHGAVVSDGRSLLIGPEQAGDEPYLMANLLPEVPVIVGSDRYAGGCLAMERFHSNVLLLDDAFQHIQLTRNLNILLLDARCPLGNGYLLPRGRLREPIHGFKRADVLVYTRSDRGRPSPEAASRLKPGHRPVFYSHHRSMIRAVLPKGQAYFRQLFDIRNRERTMRLPVAPVFAFAGLAHNAAFREAIVDLGGTIAASKGFEDHYRYTSEDIAALNSACIEAGADLMMTTDKDFVRLPPESRFVRDLIVLGVEIDFGGDSQRWRRLIVQLLEAHGYK